MTVREVLDAALAGFGGSQAELSRALGFSESTVSRWYSGKASPDPWSCLALAEIASLSPDDVLRAAGHDPRRLQVVRRSPAPPSDPPDPHLAAVQRHWPDASPERQEIVLAILGAVPPARTIRDRQDATARDARAQLNDAAPSRKPRRKGGLTAPYTELAAHLMPRTAGTVMRRAAAGR